MNKKNNFSKEKITNNETDNKNNPNNEFGKKKDSDYEFGEEKQSNNEFVENKELKNLKDSYEKRIDELTLDLKRLQAEFENYQKRSEKENENYRKCANTLLIEDLLPVIDSLLLGLEHNKEFAQVYEQLISILKKKGLEKIEVNIGDNFDHEIMDCLMQEKNNDLKDGQVVKVLSIGYKLNGFVLRPTKISINKLEGKFEKK
jgi:molecular chaperone GrpE